MMDLIQIKMYCSSYTKFDKYRFEDSTDEEGEISDNIQYIDKLDEFLDMELKN